MRRLRVGVIGLGSIARKAYLPVLAATPDIELRLCTRDRAALDAIGDAYRIEPRYTETARLIEDGLDVAFVHVATRAHVGVVQALVAAGIHVYVDKPLADNLADSARLVEEARARRCSLFVGFNRRHAPVYRQLLEPAPSLICMQKNRAGLADKPRRVVFDDFIHVVDTLRFLAPGAELDDVFSTVHDDRLGLLVVRLTAPHVVAIGVMNRDGGYTQETLETHGPGFRRVVHDMAGVDDYRADQRVAVRRDDWLPATVQRGFEDMCDRFLGAVRAGEILDAGDALRTHAMCEAIVAEIERSGR